MQGEGGYDLAKGLQLAVGSVKGAHEITQALLGLSLIHI